MADYRSRLWDQRSLLLSQGQSEGAKHEKIKSYIEILEQVFNEWIQICLVDIMRKNPAGRVICVKAQISLPLTPSDG